MSIDDVRIKLYESATVGDGYLILVDGLWTREISRNATKLDLWFRELAPSTKLRQWFNHDPLE